MAKPIKARRGRLSKEQWDAPVMASTMDVTPAQAERLILAAKRVYWGEISPAQFMDKYNRLFRGRPHKNDE